MTRDPRRQKKKNVWICRMACSYESNIKTKKNEKGAICSQLGFEICEKLAGYTTIIPLIIVYLREA